MLESDLTLEWTQEVATEASIQGCTPAVDDEHLYVGDLSGRFYALSRTDGSVVWARDREGELSDSSPYYHDGRVFVGSGGGTVYAFGADGTRCWTHDGSHAISSSPVVAQGMVFVGRNDGSVLAVDQQDGSVCWETSIGSAITAPLSYFADESAVYASTNDGTVCALDAETGRPRWSQQFGADVGASSPVIDDKRGLVYFAASEVLALDAASGDSVWGTSFYGANAGSSPVFDETYVYAGGADGCLYTISRPDGPLTTEAEWMFQSWDVSIVGDPVLRGDELLVASLGGSVYVLERGTGRQLSSTELPCEVRSSPVVADGSVYVGGCDGTVFALE